MPTARERWEKIGQEHMAAAAEKVRRHERHYERLVATLRARIETQREQIAALQARIDEHRPDRLELQIRDLRRELDKRNQTIAELKSGRRE